MASNMSRAQEISDRIVLYMAHSPYAKIPLTLMWSWNYGRIDERN